MTKWTQGVIDHCREELPFWHHEGAIKREYLSALSEIERLQKENETLKELVKDIDDKLFHLSENIVYSRDGSSHGVCSPAKETDILNDIDSIHALIQRAQEAIK